MQTAAETPGIGGSKVKLLDKVHTDVPSRKVRGKKANCVRSPDSGWEFRTGEGLLGLW